MSPNNARKPSNATALSSADYGLLVDSVIDYAIFMLDPSGHVATWNLGAEKIKGFRPSEIIGQHFSRFYPAEDIAAGKPEQMLELAREAGRVEDEGWRLRQDGSRFWASVVITALRDQSGTLRGFGKVTRDLTGHRIAEEELRQAEQRFHHLIDAVIDYAIFMLDPEGFVSTWNVGASRVKGYTAEEIIGQHFSVFYTPEDRAIGRPAQLLETVRREGRVEDESWRARKDGSRFWANVVLTALHDDHGTLVGFAKITRDLTERRKSEQRQREFAAEQTARVEAERAEKERRESEARYRALNERLEEANRSKDEFLATVSHELRTPLSAIVGWSKLLKERVTEPGMAKPLEVIYRNATAQVKIIDDILDVSRVITGKFQLEPRLVDLSLVVRDAIEVVKPSAVAKRIELELTPESERGELVADGERLQQVVWNLLSNSIKFTEPGGRVTLRVERRNSEVVLTVTDTGNGIEPAFLPYVFDRFKQADSSITRRVGGLGLGLALVRHIVELHGGRVGAWSEGKGKGSTFTVILPVGAQAPEALGEPSAPRVGAEPPAKPLIGVKILVVDDESDARDLIAEVLRERGAQIETAGSAEMGFDTVRRFRPDLLISDIGMPDEDGFTFMHRIRALSPAEGGRVPALALTAFARAEDSRAALGAGYDAHLGKPVNTDALVTTVARLAAPSKNE